MEELVDILVTTYNTNEKYLKKQIDSILRQTHKNIKIYISDDNSSDKKVAEILKEYEQKDNRIKLYIQPKNLGYNKNFEFLLQQSTANYIMFSDHDDIWYKEKVEKSLNRIKEENVDMVYCNCRQVDENGIVLQDDYFKYKNVPLVKGKSKLAISRCVGIGCSQIITKEVKEKMLPFTEKTFAHDWHSAYIANNLKGMYCIDKPLFGYRIHENNIFGGRSFKQNIKMWKEKNGNNYKSYLKYRYHTITETYLAGVLMCKDYSEKLQNNKLQKAENEIIKYFENSQKAKIMYFPIHKFFKYLYFKGIGKRAIKEIMILHFPMLSYLIYLFS